MITTDFSANAQDGNVLQRRTGGRTGNQIGMEVFEEERIIKNTFDLSIKGYLVPYSFDNIVNTQKEYSDRIGLELGVE